MRCFKGAPNCLGIKRTMKEGRIITGWSLLDSGGDTGAVTAKLPSSNPEYPDHFSCNLRFYLTWIISRWGDVIAQRVSRLPLATREINT